MCRKQHSFSIFLQGEKLTIQKYHNKRCPSYASYATNSKGLTVDGLKFIALYNKQKKIVFFIQLYLINCFNLLNQKNFIPLYSSYETFDNFITNKFKLRIIMVFNLCCQKSYCTKSRLIKDRSLKEIPRYPTKQSFFEKKGSL